MKRQLLLVLGCLLLIAGWLSAFLSRAIPLQSDYYYFVPALLLGVGVGTLLKLLSGFKVAILVVVMGIVSIVAINQIYPAGRISITGFMQRMETEIKKGKPVVVAVSARQKDGIFSSPRELSALTELRVQLFAQLPDGARMLAFDDAGRLYVSLPELGAIYQLSDANGDGFAEQPVLYHVGLDRPHGLVWKGNKLYVAETSRLLQLVDKDQDNQVDEITVVLDGLPDDGGHWTRSLALGADGLLYLSIGSRCNACDEADPLRATVLQVDPDNATARVFVKGLRNSVGLAFSPDGKTLWGSDNGRDMLGDDLPPDEINRLVADGDYGWPNCFGKQVADPEVNPGGNCKNTIPAAVELPAHSAPLGIAFGDRLQAPEAYRNSLYVAFHGSWNRTTPTGYKLIRIPFVDGELGAPKEFLFGWLRDGKAWGRPVAPLVGPDGSLYLSDDRADAIYRISWTQKE